MRALFSVCCVVFVGCASRASLTGHETLAALRASIENPRSSGGGADGDCWLKQDANSCAWVSAFWKADYADADHNCRSGDVKRCKDAVAYAAGCEVRGLISGGGTERNQDFYDEGGGPLGCYDDEPYPPSMVTPPPSSASKALEYLAIECKRGGDTCSDVEEALYNGMIMGLRIPQDFETAKALCLAHKPDAYELDPNGCDHHARTKESAEDRDARLARVEAVYAGDKQLWANFSTKTSQYNADQEGATLRSIMTGVSDGVAVNAGVNASLANAQKNINTTVAQSNADKSVPATGAPTSSTPPSKPTAAQLAVADKRKSLDACLARPITQLRTAQTNPFIADRQGFESLLASAQRCMAQPWQACMFSPTAGALWAVEGPADTDHSELFRRFNAPGIHIGGSTDVCLDQPIKGTRRDCETDVSSNRGACIARLKQDIAQLNCDFVMLPKVWAAENTKNDADAKGRQDDACHRQFD